MVNDVTSLLSIQGTYRNISCTRSQKGRRIRGRERENKGRENESEDRGQRKRRKVTERRGGEAMREERWTATQGGFVIGTLA